MVQLPYLCFFLQSEMSTIRHLLLVTDPGVYLYFPNLLAETGCWILTRFYLEVIFFGILFFYALSFPREYSNSFENWVCVGRHTFEFLKFEVRVITESYWFRFFSFTITWWPFSNRIARQFIGASIWMHSSSNCWLKIGAALSSVPSYSMTIVSSQEWMRVDS